MKKLVILSGAGISAESGISTFRDAGGLWDKYPVMQVASIEGYEANPELVIRFYNERRRQLLDVSPNEGHRKCAELEKHFDVSVITQNVDNLHARAGSSNVIYLHGELMKACSSRDPEDPRYITELSTDHLDILPDEKAGDGSLLRPFIVWFGEAVPQIEPAAEACQKADIFIIIGTSLQVYPAAGLIRYCPPGIPIFLIDPKEVGVPHNLHVTVIRDVASKGMRKLVEMLRNKA